MRAALTIVLLSAGCFVQADPAPPPAATAPASTGPAHSGGGYGGSGYGGGVTVGDGIPVEQIAGHWAGREWGDLYVRASSDGNVWGVYPHDTGTVVGRVDPDGVFRGWWCEAPSRQPPGDAGDVEWRFGRGADGTLQLDGRWRYGSEGTFRENWDLTWTDAAVDPALASRFDDASQFCLHP